MYVGRHFMLSAHKHCYCRYANTYTQYTYYVHTNIKYTDTHYTENISFTIHTDNHASYVYGHMYSKW